MVLLHVIRYFKLRYYGVVTCYTVLKLRHYDAVQCYAVFKIILR